MNQSSLENAELGTSGKSLMNTQNEEKLKVWLNPKSEAEQRPRHEVKFWKEMERLLENWSSKSGWSHLFRVQCKMPSEVEFCYHEQQWPTLRAMICNRAQGWSWKNDLSPIQVKTSTYSHDKIWTTVTRRDCKLRQKKGQHQCMSVCLLKVIHVEVPFTRGFTESFRNIAWSLSWS